MKLRALIQFLERVHRDYGDQEVKGFCYGWFRGPNDEGMIEYSARASDGTVEFDVSKTPYRCGKPMDGKPLGGGADV